MLSISKYSSKLDKGTILRTVLQILAYGNQIMALFSNLSFADSNLYQWVTIVITILMTAVSYWYNNDWTRMARMTRDIFDMLKDGTITEEEISEFIEDHSNAMNSAE